MTEPINLEFLEYVKPVWRAWDAKGIPCPRNPAGWMANYWELVNQKAKEDNKEWV